MFRFTTHGRLYVGSVVVGVFVEDTYLYQFGIAPVYKSINGILGMKLKRKSFW